MSFFALVLLKSGIWAAQSNVFLSNLLRYPLSIYFKFRESPAVWHGGNDKQETTLVRAEGQTFYFWAGTIRCRIATVATFFIVQSCVANALSSEDEPQIPRTVEQRRLFIRSFVYFLNVFSK